MCRTENRSRSGVENATEIDHAVVSQDGGQAKIGRSNGIFRETVLNRSFECMEIDLATPPRQRIFLQTVSTQYTTLEEGNEIRDHDSEGNSHSPNYRGV